MRLAVALLLSREPYSPLEDLGVETPTRLAPKPLIERDSFGLLVFADCRLNVFAEH